MLGMLVHLYKTGSTGPITVSLVSYSYKTATSVVCGHWYCRYCSFGIIRSWIPFDRNFNRSGKEALDYWFCNGGRFSKQSCHSHWNWSPCRYLPRETVIYTEEKARAWEGNSPLLHYCSSVGLSYFYSFWYQIGDLVTFGENPIQTTLPPRARFIQRILFRIKRFFKVQRANGLTLNWMENKRQILASS